MGSAVAAGLLRTMQPGEFEITVGTPHPEKAHTLADAGATLTASNREAASGADCVILAVKPWVLPDAVSDIRGALKPGAEVCAIVAGVSCEDFRAMFGEECPDALSIAMPNTAMTAGESMTFITQVCGSARLACAVFNRLGHTEIIEERLLPGATALASCGIAYAMRYVRAACEGGVELGFRASEAQRIVAQTLRGAAALLDREGAHPETEIDKVTTPGGLTIRGLNAMERAGFTNAVIEGLKASVK